MKIQYNFDDILSIGEQATKIHRKKTFLLWNLKPELKLKPHWCNRTHTCKRRSLDLDTTTTKNVEQEKSERSITLCWEEEK